MTVLRGNALKTARISAGRRAFSCAGPSAWNSLPEYLTVDTLTLDYFKQSLKCVLFARYWHSAWSALGICNDSALYKCTLNNNNNNNTQIWSHTEHTSVFCVDKYCSGHRTHTAGAVTRLLWLPSARAVTKRLVIRMEWFGWHSICKQQLL